MSKVIDLSKIEGKPISELDTEEVLTAVIETKKLLEEFINDFKESINNFEKLEFNENTIRLMNGCRYISDIDR